MQHYYIVHGKEVLPFVCEKDPAAAAQELAERLGYAWDDLDWQPSVTAGALVFLHKRTQRIVGKALPHKFQTVGGFV